MNNRDKIYNVKMNREQLDAIAVLVQMAQILSWELYGSQNAKYEKEKELVKIAIDDFHSKGYEGIMAVLFDLGHDVDKFKYDIDNSKKICYNKCRKIKMRRR